MSFRKRETIGRKIKTITMPELPEVETIKRDLEKRIIGLTIEEVIIADMRVVKDLSKNVFVKRTKGKIIKDVTRRAKALVISFEPQGFLIVQLRMTGQLIYESKSSVSKQSSVRKVTFKLSDGSSLYYNDQRTLGWLIYAKSLEDDSYLNQVGPEPLGDDFTKKWLASQLKRRTAPIKTLLMNQNFLAGIGNIYASEILFDAGIHPERLSKNLHLNEVNQLHKSIRSILNKAIKARGTSMRDYRDSSGEKGKFLNRIKVYGRDQEECFVCHSEIKRIVQAGRSTFFCENCQIRVGNGKQ